METKVTPMQVFPGVDHERLVAYISGIVGRDEAEDVVQTAYLKAVKATPQFRNESSVWTWVSQIAKRTAFDLLRERRRRPSEPIFELVGTNEGADTRAEVQNTLDVALARLTPSQREVLVAVAEHGSNKAASIALGMRITTLKTRVSRARIALRSER